MHLGAPLTFPLGGDFVGVAVTGAPAMFAGRFTQLVAVASRGDGSTFVVTRQAQWTTSDGTVASVDGGRVTGWGPGAATITATFNGLPASLAITVTIELVDHVAEALNRLPQMFKNLNGPDLD